MNNLLEQEVLPQIGLQGQHNHQGTASEVTEQQKHKIITEGLNYLNQHKMKTTAHKNCIKVSLNKEPQAVAETSDIKMSGDLYFREYDSDANKATTVRNDK